MASVTGIGGASTTPTGGAPAGNVNTGTAFDSALNLLSRGLDVFSSFKEREAAIDIMRKETVVTPPPATVPVSVADESVPNMIARQYGKVIMGGLLLIGGVWLARKVLKG